MSLADTLKRDPLYPTTPCTYCGEPVGYGEHEKYCEENPVNLVRNCGYIGCEYPGNHIYDYEWICKYHADLRNARSKLKSRKDSISYAKSTIDRLQTELQKVRISIPQMMADEVEAEENLKQIEFKNVLAGVETKV